MAPLASSNEPEVVTIAPHRDRHGVGVCSTGLLLVLPAHTISSTNHRNGNTWDYEEVNPISSS